MQKQLHLGKAIAVFLVFLATGCREEKPAGQPQQVESHPVQADMAMPAGMVAGTRITEPYARMMARNIYFWAWPMVNVYNRRLAFSKSPEPGIMNDLPFAPLNRLAMLSDYVAPAERWVACPNQDVVYGAGILALDQSPAVIQVPDFGKRFWVYQIVDLRTDSFADVGAMYGTKPGFYLLAGPDWKGTVPSGITGVFHAKSNTGMVIPRAFLDDTAEDKSAVQSVINGIAMYPLSDFDGKVKTVNWKNIRKYPSAAAGAGETRWVFPDRFFDQLPEVLRDAKPLQGEEVMYAQVSALLDAAQKDPAVKKALTDEAVTADKEVIDPLLHFRTWGVGLSNNWTTIRNGAAFGTDYFTRTAVARSNIMVNKPAETAYFYQDLDDTGMALNGRNHYVLTFAARQMPPVKGFWSLTMYDQYHFFVPNAINRYSVGTKNKDLKTDADGSLSIYIQAEPPTDPLQRANWLPSPKSGDFTLYTRAYWPDTAITNGEWTPPAVKIVH